MTHARMTVHEADAQLITAAEDVGHVKRRVRRSGALWPAASTWDELRRAVGGHLIEVQPLLPHASDAAAALRIREDLKNPYWISDQPASTQTSGWLDAWTPATSAYAIKARGAADVCAGIAFARRHNLRIVVKGTGHSYLGTSNAPDSLLIWTRALDAVTLHDAFVGQGCEGRVAPAPAVSAGAGAMWVDLYHAVTVEGGRYVQGGGCLSVGVAGLVQSGGFGVFSKKFGTAASSLLEAEIVTADGHVRVVNACSDPDLFWAIKGGGGGTFGVLTRITLRTHELPTTFGSAVGRLEARSDAAFKALVARFVSFYRDALCNPHWGDHVHFGPGNAFELAMVCQGLDDEQVVATWRPFFDWVTSLPQDYSVNSPFVASAADSRAWWDVRRSGLLKPDPRPDSPRHWGWSHCDEAEIGVFLHGYDSLWLPSSLLRDERQAELTDAIYAASRHQMVRLQLAKGLAGAPAETVAAARDTATNPAVLQAFTLAVVADGEGPAYPGLAGRKVDAEAARRNARAIDHAIAELRKVAPDGGSYVSESNYFNPNWQEDFWGDNYPRLLEAKRRYDPGGLFFVHHGVGSEGWSADGFERLS